MDEKFGVVIGRGREWDQLEIVVAFQEREKSPKLGEFLVIEEVGFMRRKLLARVEEFSYGDFQATKDERIRAYVYGLTLWFWALLLTYLIWGIRAVFIGLFIAGIGVIPIAILATALNGEWIITGEIILLLVLTCGSRMLGLYFAEKVDEINNYE